MNTAPTARMAHPDTASGTRHSCGRTWLTAASCRINAAFRPASRLHSGAVSRCAQSRIPTCPRTRLDSVWIWAAVLLGTILLSGCLSRPSLVKQSFTLSYPPATSTATTATQRVLGIKRLTIAAPFDDQSLAYRTGEFSYERDPYAEFLVPPTETFTIAIRGYFRDSGLFSTVSEAGSACRPDLLVEIVIDQLYGDFRHRSDSFAVLSMRFIFFDAPDGTPAMVLVQKGCSRQIRLKARTATSLIEGWNEALKQVLDEVCSDLKTTECLAAK